MLLTGQDAVKSPSRQPRQSCDGRDGLSFAVELHYESFLLDADFHPRPRPATTPRTLLGFGVAACFDSRPLALLANPRLQLPEDGQDFEHRFAKRRADVHGFTKTEESHPPGLKLAHDGEEVQEVAANAIHGVADELVAGAKIGHEPLPTGPVERQAREPFVLVPFNGFVLALQPLAQFVLLRLEVLIFV